MISALINTQCFEAVDRVAYNIPFNK